MTSVEIVQFPLSRKYAMGKAVNLPAMLFKNLADCATAHDIAVTMTTPETCRWQSDWLMLYGPGGLDRQTLMQKQLHRGGHVVCWDAPYWQRGAKLRVSIDHAHPQAWVMKIPRSVDRFCDDLAETMDGIIVANAYNPSANGDVLIAGIGTKANLQYGTDVVRQWEHQMVVAARLLWGDRRRIVYRPKPNHPTSPPIGAHLIGNELGIEMALRGASVVVTWHSNVAVDAIHYGLPVVCHDGAAAAICPSTLSPDIRPLPDDLRIQFLSNLAWFQWRPDEANEVWRFLLELLSPPQSSAASF